VLIKIQILVKSEMLVKNWNFGENKNKFDSKTDFYSKIEILLKHYKSCNFCQKIEILAFRIFWTFTEKSLHFTKTKKLVATKMFLV